MRGPFGVLEVVYLLDDTCVWKDHNKASSIKPVKQQMLSLASLTIIGLHFCSLDKLERMNFTEGNQTSFFSRCCMPQNKAHGILSPLADSHLSCAVTDSMCPVFLFQIYGSPILNLPLAGKLGNASRCCAVLSSPCSIRNASNCSMLQVCQSCGWWTLTNNPGCNT